jgi:hypothetical protein
MTERIAEQTIGNWQSDRHNLPVQLTSFIGREREVAAVRALLQRPEIRLVTLTGPGGIGKTRLGLQVSTELMEGFSDGVFRKLLRSSGRWAIRLALPDHSFGRHLCCFRKAIVRKRMQWRRSPSCYTGT